MKEAEKYLWRLFKSSCHNCVNFLYSMLKSITHDCDPHFHDIFIEQSDLRNEK